MDWSTNATSLLLDQYTVNALEVSTIPRVKTVPSWVFLRYRNLSLSSLSFLLLYSLFLFHLLFTVLFLHPRLLSSFLRSFRSSLLFLCQFPEGHSFEENVNLTAAVCFLFFFFPTGGIIFKDVGSWRLTHNEGKRRRRLIGWPLIKGSPGITGSRIPRAPMKGFWCWSC